MSNTPQDPAQNSIQQSQNQDSSYESEQGYGVHFEDGRFTNESLQQTPPGGRSGSYEAQNTGGYGTTPPGAPGTPTDDEPVSPPDPQAQQGQGGQ